MILSQLSVKNFCWFFFFMLCIWQPATLIWHALQQEKMSKILEKILRLFYLKNYIENITHSAFLFSVGSLHCIYQLWRGGSILLCNSWWSVCSTTHSKYSDLLSSFIFDYLCHFWQESIFFCFMSSSILFLDGSLCWRNVFWQKINRKAHHASAQRWCQLLIHLSGSSKDWCDIKWCNDRCAKMHKGKTLWSPPAFISFCT